MANLDPREVDVLAELYLVLQQEAETADTNLAVQRKKLIEKVLAEGSVPARATKTKALAGEEYELRVSRPLEITVDTKTALRIKAACLAAGARRIFSILFRRVETFILVDGAEKLLNGPRLPKGAPRNLRALFARAVRVHELASQLEVRKLKKGDKAA